MAISKLETVPIRKAFAHEAHDFTVWLEANLEALCERIGLSLTVVEREKSVGSFSVDLLCEDAQGNPVIIENQLERSDHDHLGKVLTYMVNLEAKTAVWIVSDVRQEHLRVVDWLNESTASDISFYLVKIEAIRIGDSALAPLFSILAQPDEQIREIGEQKKALANNRIEKQRLNFWTQLLEKAQDTKFKNISPRKYNWISVSAGKSGIQFIFSILKDQALVDLYIDADKDTGEGNKRAFDQLIAYQDEIENLFGDTLEWRRLDDKRASRIAYTMASGGLNSPDKWDEIQDKMIETMIRFDDVLRPYIKNII